MKIIRKEEKAGPRVLALGTFDGVHRGHQELIRLGKQLSAELGAALRVCVFDRHPLEVLCPDRAPQMLQTPEEQQRRIEKLGVEELRIIPFTSAVAETEPEEFLQKLSSECELRGIVVGWNYTFGRLGSGSPETLRQAGARHGFQVCVVPPVRTESGEIISSSAIRDKLLNGDPEGAAEMLGMPYLLSGKVVNGKHQGTRIGFPTANIETSGKKLLPAHGVYACRMECEGKVWDSVLNIGLQPTIPSGKVTVESHALDADIDLYGKTASVSLLKYLRPERKFPSLEGLIAQISMDRENARSYFRTH